ncbi:MAG: MFS transporter [Treponema sp.]|jgi:MFS family permease|nr:MFS transporter [Treponema sp.]
MRKNLWKPIIFATLTILVSSGIRNTVGLFVNPLVENTVLSLTQVSMAMAIGQFTFGLFQPLGGVFMAKYKTFTILLTGTLCLVVGFLGVQLANSALLIILCFGLLTPAGAAASSFPILMGHISKSVPDEKRSISGGLINAGGSAGTFVLAPLIQMCLNAYGLYGACIFLAIVAALSLVPSWFLCRGKAEPSPGTAPETVHAGIIDTGLKKEMAKAFRNPSYLFLHAGFFTCGFHVAFLATHLPGEIIFFGFSGSFSAFCFSVLGICNFAGCILVGIAGGFFTLKNLLAGLYFIRVLLIGLYIFAPKTAPVFIIFAAIAGFTYGSTVPPTGAITARLVSPQNLGTLLALVFVTHQLGSFFGAWLGGLIMDHTGSFMTVWILNAVLALFAAIVSFKINEHKTKH